MEIDRELEKTIDEITEIAKGFGLDFYPMRYEICPADIIYTFGAYGMPTRFSHWSFGKQFHKMKLHYDLGLSKFYELVINSNPCYGSHPKRFSVALRHNIQCLHLVPKYYILWFLTTNF